jgi:hypothetical protein
LQKGAVINIDRRLVDLTYGAQTDGQHRNRC